MEGFIQRQQVEEKPKWLYELGLPLINYHLTLCTSQNLNYVETLEYLVKILAADNKAMEKIIIGSNQKILITG